MVPERQCKVVALDVDLSIIIDRNNFHADDRLTILK